MLRLLTTSGVDLIAQMPLLSTYLHRIVPSFSLSMIRVDERCVPTAHYSEYFDDASHRLFAASGDYFATKSADPAAFANLMRNADAVGTLVEAPPGYFDGMVYRGLFTPNGIHHTLDVALRAQGMPLAILGLFREHRTRAFAASDVSAIREVYPHLVHACFARPIPGRFDEIEGAMLIVDRAGTIQFASPLARGWLEDATFGPERARLLDAGMIPAVCRELVTRLDRCRRGATIATPELVLPVPGGRLRLRAYRLDSTGVTQELVAVQLSLEVDHRLRVLSIFDRVALPPQLARLAMALVAGRTTPEILVELGLRVTTLKSYQRDLYRRFEVANAAELVERIEELATTLRFDSARHRPSLKPAGTRDLDDGLDDRE
jgi:hypothetical protein